MTNWAERVKPLLIAATAAAVGAVLLGVGVSNGDVVLAAGGAAALLGALALAAVALGLLRRVWAAPVPGAPNVKHVWRPSEDGTAPPPATDAEVAAVELALGRPLPRVYRHMVSIQNGGDLRYPLWVSPEVGGGRMRYFAIYTLSGVGEGDALSRTPEMIRSGVLPRGLACIMEGDDWDLCLDYRNRDRDDEPSVVALDAERREYVLAATMQEFVGGLTRDLRHHVYAAQGALGSHPDMLLMGLNAALRVQLAPIDAKREQFGAACAAWRAIDGKAPAAVRLVWNGFDRDHGFPETRSKWQLCCDIDPCHREELERRLRETDFRWRLLHAPAHRLLEAGFFGSGAAAGSGD